MAGQGATGPRRILSVAPLLAVGLAIAVGALTLDGTFVYDDARAIVENPVVTGGVPLWEALVRDVWGAPLSGPAHGYRPAMTVVWRALFAAAGGAALPFRLLTIVLHGLATYTVLRVATRFLSPLAATLAAIAFAVHPVHAEALGGIVGQADIAATAAGLWAWRIGWATPRRAVAAIGVLALAIACKETALIFVPVILLASPRPPRVAVAVGVAGSWLALAAAAAALHFSIDRSVALDPTNNIGLAAEGFRAVLYGLHVIGRATAMCFVPTQLAPNHGYAATSLSTGFLTPYAITGAAFVVIAGVAAGLAVVRRRPEVLALLILLMGPIVAQSNLLFPTITDLAERLLYLPSVVACGLLGHGAARLWPRGVVARGGVGAGVVALMIGTAVAQRPWVSPRTLWTRAARIEPKSLRSQANLGAALLNAGQDLEGAWHRMLAEFIRRSFPRPVLWAPIEALEEIPLPQRLHRAPAVLQPADPCGFATAFMGDLQATRPDLASTVGASVRASACGAQRNR